MINLLLLFLLPIACFCELITVETSRGPVQGFDQDFGNDRSQRFFGYGQVFLGIPFAKAPLGERRFTLPEDICQYNERGEVHNATYYRPSCWQINLPPDQISEDCLYLNVMTPNVTGNYPVMVYIHGGNLCVGGAERYHWKGAVRNLVSHGVVVVTIQYRLGAIGFFTTYTDTFPPNRGIYDQIVALRWVNEEIANFGGDSSRITIFGQSAGGACVSDLSLSPLTRGLFHQTAQTSGQSLIEIETISDVRGSIHQLRANQICQIDSSDWGSEDKDEALMNCLLQKPPQDLVAFDFTDNKDWYVAIDGALMPDYPENLAASRPKYPAMMGDLLDDFASFIPGVFDGDISNITDQSNQDILKATWPSFDDETVKHISDMMITEYSDGTLPASDDHLGWTKLITEMGTGAFISSDLIRDVQWHQKAGNDKIWLFTFAYRSLLPFNLTIEGWTPIAHGAELPFLWYYPNIWETYNASDSDYFVADYMGGLWTAFAMNGELPLPKANKEMNYVEIGNLPSYKSNWQSEANTLFNEEIPAYLGEPLLTMSDESWTTVKKLGEKVLSKWNSMPQCQGKAATSTMPATTSDFQIVSTSLLTSVFLILFMCLR